MAARPADRPHLRLCLLAVFLAVPWLYGISFPFQYDDIGMIEENAFLENRANLVQVLTGRTLADPEILNGRRPAVLYRKRSPQGLYPDRRNRTGGHLYRHDPKQNAAGYARL